MVLRGAILALLMVSIAGAASAHAAKPPAILYAADARGAIIADGRLSVPAGTRVTWFTDRPSRAAGTTTMHVLQQLWTASGFAADPPNAALLLTDRGRTRTHVVELTAPRYADRRVSFALRRIPSGTHAGHRDSGRLEPGRHGRAALFIDDAAIAPCAIKEYALTAQAGSCLLAPGSVTEVDYGGDAQWVGFIRVNGCATGVEAGSYSAVANDLGWAVGPCGTWQQPLWTICLCVGEPTAGPSARIENTPTAGAPAVAVLTISYTPVQPG